MRLRKATCLASTLLLAAGLGVFANSAQAQSAPKKKKNFEKIKPAGTRAESPRA